ncbi:MAG: helix-turn-helix transcriptional regulator [candidate division NC10 bacterium]|nr:helix-turn-helix transcriptional regulator [candidate division NC10 bacterium]
MPKSPFGSLFKELRIRQKVTLRQFCEGHGYDPGNISKLERGLLPPPESKEKLTEYAKALKIRRGSDAWYQFFDLARASRGKLPPEILRKRDVVARLPLLFRTLRGQKVSEQKLNELIEMIRRA